VKLLSREAGRLVFRLSKRDHEALLTTLRLRPLFPRRPRSIASDAEADQKLRAAQQDLDAALEEHRTEQVSAVESLMSDTARCAAQPGGGWRLTLNEADAEMLLQALNEIRVGSWEKLGAPDFESGQHPELNEENFLALWAFQLSEVFQGTLLAAMTGETEE
jgi:hypothetical protein